MSFIAPKDELHKWISYYFHLGFPDTKIADHALDHFDRNIYGLSPKSVQRIRSNLGLKGTIQQAATFETLLPIYNIIRPRFPTMGARRMVTHIRLEYKIRVAEKLVNDFLRTVEPLAVTQRKRRQFKQGRYYPAGVMECWSIDQHDKWERFGLWLHLGTDPCTGRFAWFRIWWCNRNPRLLMSYYLAAARMVKGIPLLTMSDSRRENNGIANMHTLIRHQLDPSLRNTLQHRLCPDKKNIKYWSQFHAQLTPGFEDTFDFGVNSGFYTASDPLENLVFRWLAIPWLQAEIDKWVVMYNSSTRRANKCKTLPHGIPDIIHAKPERFNLKNFQIMVSDDMFNAIEEEWVPHDDPVFQLTPMLFHKQAEAYYISLGRPAISKGTFWDVYNALLGHFRQGPPDIMLAEQFKLANLGPEEETMDLLPGLQALPVGDEVIGDGVVLQEDSAEGDFTDSDNDNTPAADFTDDATPAADFTDDEG